MTKSTSKRPKTPQPEQYPKPRASQADDTSRHAKDFFGRSLYVGDEVATLMPGYRYTLVSGSVVRITAKMLRVDIVLPDAPAGQRRVITVAECQVVKRCRQ